ncbi:MAG: hypothetical protein KDC71_22100 [Acidobacteria bacterium]|nr:hypothetical protein [Acidobacteriota bacterium]
MKFLFEIQDFFSFMTDSVVVSGVNPDLDRFSFEFIYDLIGDRVLVKYIHGGEGSFDVYSTDVTRSFSGKIVMMLRLKSKDDFSFGDKVFAY